LQDYKERIFIDKNYVLERRKSRYDLEEELFNQFGYYYERNENCRILLKVKTSLVIQNHENANEILMIMNAICK
jgi:hypothetical protein